MLPLIPLVLLLSLASYGSANNVIIMQGETPVITIPVVNNDTMDIHLLNYLLFDHNKYVLDGGIMCDELKENTPFSFVVELIQKQLGGRGHYLNTQACQELNSLSLTYHIRTSDVYPMNNPSLMICVPVKNIMFICFTVLILLCLYVIIKNLILARYNKEPSQTPPPPDYSLVVEK